MIRRHQGLRSAGSIPAPRRPCEVFRRYTRGPSLRYSSRPPTCGVRDGEVPAGYTVRPRATVKPGHQPLPARATNAPGACITVPRPATHHRRGDDPRPASRG